MHCKRKKKQETRADLTRVDGRTCGSAQLRHPAHEPVLSFRFFAPYGILFFTIRRRQMFLAGA